MGGRLAASPLMIPNNRLSPTAKRLICPPPMA
jgi:hypothetical protein